MSKEHEPIAITGMACRFPGGCSNPMEFWELLCNPTGVVREIDGERWSTEFYYHPDRSAPGKTYGKHAALLDDVFQFDPEFFGISPREAIQMDPQQRMLLEMTWEALEDAGLPPGRLAGSDCSVFVGISSTDYANSRFDDPSVADGYFMTGNTLSIAANRISYLFDLHGPSMAIDTACSSSLVALHQACTGIWSGQSETSIVGSAQLLLSPFPFIGFSKASMLSETGECRVFGKDANGYVRSEGGAVLLLKPLSRALADGDPVHAVIRATGVNTDGHKSALTVPNGNAQQHLLRKLYHDNGIRIEDINYIEAHGTGTPVGDPVEAAAIGEAIGRRRNGAGPLPIGSVKAIIGHLEPASGMAGLLKVVLGLKHRAIPAAGRVGEYNPAIDFSGLNLKVVEEYTPLEDDGGNLLMGVNSFGFGGSNAHIILEEHRPEQAAAAPGHAGSGDRPPLYLSARSVNSLRMRARQFIHLLEQSPPGQEAYDLFYSAAFHREPLTHGLIAWGNDHTEIAAQLQDFCNDDTGAKLVTGEHHAQPGRIAFVYSGNGSQWPEMARGLLRHPVFRDSIEAVDRLFMPLADWSIVEALEGEQGAPDIEHTEIAQPLLFAIQTGITAMLRQYGIEATGVTGHSVGEVAAAWAAGVLSLEDAVQVIYYRSLLQAATKGKGRMLAANLAPDDVAAVIEEMKAPLELAAVNSPGSTTLTGSHLVIERAARKLQELKIRCRVLDIDYPFHSAAMDMVRERFSRIMPSLTHKDGEIGFYSTVHGRAVPGSDMDREYWWQNIRHPVRFGPAVETMLGDGYELFIEIGPHPVLQSYIRECLHKSQADGRVVTTLRRGADDDEDSVRRAAFSTCLHQGVPPRAFFPHKGRYVPLPTYPWDRKPYRFQGTREAINRKRDHILLGFHLNNIDGIWENHVDTATHPFLNDHVVDDNIVMPAAAFAEMALAASRLSFDRSHHEIANLEIRRPLILDQSQTRNIQFSLNTEDLNFTIKSKPRLSDQSWKTHVVGRLINAASDYATPRVNVGEIKQRSRYEVDGEEIYDTAAILGLVYGPSFRAVQNVWVGEDELLSRIELSPQAGSMAEEFMVHPAYMDAAFHTLFPAFAERRDRSFESHASPYLPVSIGDLRFHRAIEGPCYCLCRIDSAGKEIINATFILLDDGGRPLVELKNCVFRRYAQRSSRKKLPLCLTYEQIPRDLPLPNTVSPVHDIDLTAVIDRLDNVSAVTGGNHTNGGELQQMHRELAIALALDALYQLGAHLEEFTVDSLMASAQIPERHRHYINYLLRFLETEDHARDRDGHWKIALGINGAPEKWKRILETYPHHLDDMFFAASHGFDLVRSLTAESMDDYQRKSINWYLQRYNSSKLSNEIVRTILEHVMQYWPRERRRLRVADIGLGSSARTRTLVSMLPSQWCDLTILAGDEEEASLAEREFADVVNVRVKRLDLSESDGTSDTANDQYDIVLVSRYLYEFDDAPALLSLVSKRVQPGGISLFLDRTPDPLCDVLYGTNPEWWSRSLDVARPVSRLMEPEQWLTRFHRHGLEDAQLITGKALVGARESVFLAARGVPESTRAGHEDTSVGSEPIVLISDRDGDSRRLAQQLRERLEADGHSVLWVMDDPDQAADSDGGCIDLETGNGFDALAAGITNGSTRCDSIVYLPGFTTTKEIKGTEVLDKQQRTCMGVIHLARHMEELFAGKPRIWFVTGYSLCDSRGSAMPPPQQAALWGFVRVLRNEYSDGDFRLVDIQGQTDFDEIAANIDRELTAADGEDEILLDKDARRVPRLSYLSDPATNSLLRHMDSTQVEAWQLISGNPGNFRDMKWRETARRRPAEGEVEIKVMAAGLNFRDIMYASGLLPDEMLDDGFAGANLGLECSGIVTAVGEGVERFRAGDEVLTFASACFSSHVIAPVTTVIPKPASWSFESAATVPTAFFTVFYAVSHLAGLKQGEKILIHGATGGVGLAAIQYAQHCGAEIFATAGTDEKRRFLSLLGIRHVLNSRSLDFADEIMNLTDGEGIDVVLNSLAGEAIDKSLSVLRPGGRFLELGKRDYFENTRIGLRPFRHNIAYYGVDADQLIRRQPELSQDLFNEVMKLFESGVFKPLPQTVFDADGVIDAFRLMQQSHHIGKVIVSLRRPPSQIDVPMTGRRFELKANASYLVSGGLSGFGLATARWLVDKGAQHLILVSRNGMPAPEDENELASLRNRGVDVMTMACDVADPVSLQRVLREVKDRLPPLRGVVHSAMVLDDHLIRDMTMESLEKAMKPKIQGAWNLHQLTRDLDFFVLYSSVTACLGNPGQANYVAGNQYLEALAHYRRNRGLPSTVVAWDAIMDSGYLARNTALRESLSKRHGINGVNSVQALQTLERLLETDQTHAIVLNPNWQRLARNLGKSSKFDWLLHNLPQESSSDEQGFLDEMEAMDPAERHNYLADLIAGKVADILKVSTDKLKHSQPLHDLGIDSLMAMELATAIENHFGVEIPLMSLADNATIDSLARNLGETLAPQLNADAGNATEKVVALQDKAVDDRQQPEQTTSLPKTS
ncbi:MAG: SDR family NAD(P)-dependent oxidoreductase [Gammaproteobacteria bacterium]